MNHHKNFYVFARNFRLQRVKKLWWDTGSSIPDELQEKLCPKELKFFKEYSDLLGNYQAHVDVDLAQVFDLFCFKITSLVRSKIFQEYW